MMTDEQAAEIIREAVAELAKHPRFRGKMFGPVQALEVLYCLRVFLDKQPRPVTWPKAEGLIWEGWDE